MAASTILLDSSIIIEFFRKSKKERSVFHQLASDYMFSVSVITDFEIRIGLKSNRQKIEYQMLMSNIQILPLDQSSIDHAVRIYADLKKKNALLELADLLIGATAIRYSLPLATLNRKHFSRIENIELVKF